MRFFSYSCVRTPLLGLEYSLFCMFYNNIALESSVDLPSNSRYRRLSRREEFKGPFSHEVSRALKHIKSAVTEYGAHYGFLICVGHDGKIWYCTTANVSPDMFWTEEFAPLMSRYLKRVHGHEVRKMLIYRYLEDIFGAGHKAIAKQNTHGIRNKVESFKRISVKLAEEDPSGKYPVLAMFSNKAEKHYIVHPNPDHCPQMAQIWASTLDAITKSEKRIPTNYTQFGGGCVSHTDEPEKTEALRLLSVSSRTHLKRGLKRKATRELPSTFMPARKAGLKEGTWQWYQATARQHCYTLGKPLVHSALGVSWACSDARLSPSEGRLVNVDKDMLVVVRSSNPETFECSCTIFRHYSNCVHVEYTRMNYISLINQRFHDGSSIFRVTKNDGKTLAGYCCDGALVRIISESKSHLRLKCEIHQVHDCVHVRRVYKHLTSGKLFQGGRENGPDEDWEEEEEEDPYQNFSKFDRWLEIFGKSITIHFPYEDGIKRAVLERLTHGFADNVPGVKPLESLMPETPGTCHCGIPYSEKDIIQTKDVTVYLRAPYCSRTIPCYSVRCQAGNEDCTIHYTGIHDGLWRVSRDAAVELDILVSAARDFVKQSGPSLQSIWETIQDRYLHYGIGSNAGFIHSNTFRLGLFNVCKALNTYEGAINKVFSEKPEMKPPNCMLCPICKDSPRVVICDGTTMTLKKKLCHAKAFTNVHDKSYKLLRRHNKNVRCFFGSEPTDQKMSSQIRKKRDMLMSSYLKIGGKSKGLLDLFGDWILEDIEMQERFAHFEEMREKAALWDLGEFLDWVQASKIQGSLSTHAREAIVTFLRHISTMDAVSSYIPYSVAVRLEEYLSGEHSVIPAEALGGFGFVLEHLFRSVLINGTVTVPNELRKMLDRLIYRSKLIYEYRREWRHPLDNNRDPYRDRELGDEIPEEQRRPSVVSGEYLDSGIISGLPRIRHRPSYQADNASEGSQRDKPRPTKPMKECRHAFGDSCGRTGGIFTCMCEHGIAYASWVIKTSEGRDDPFTFLTCFLKEAPSVVVYDFACGLMDYCLNRAPEYFKHCRFVVDKFHERNHEGCSEAMRMVQFYSSGEVAPPNTQLCEQINKHMKRYKKTLHNMKQYGFMTMLRAVLEAWNVSKYKLLVKGGYVSKTAMEKNETGSIDMRVHPAPMEVY